MDIALDEPLNEGYNVASDHPAWMPVSIDGRSYKVIPADVRIRTLPTVRPGQDAGEPSENSLNNEGLWRRSQVDWSLGAGQTWLDDGDDSDRHRFRTSVGIDPWTRRLLQLHHDATTAHAAAGSGDGLVTNCAGVLVVVDGAQVLRDTTGTGASLTSLATLAAAGLDLAFDGAWCYVATASGLYRFDPTSGAAPTVWCAQACERVGYALGRLIIAHLTELFEVSAAGAATSVFDHTNAAHSWVDIVEAPQGIYAAGGTDGRGGVWVITEDPDTGGLRPPIFAGGLEDGETILCADYAGGFLTLGTSIGLRLAQIGAGLGGGTDLSIGAAIEVDGGVTAIETFRQFAWFSLSDFDFERPDGTVEQWRTGLGRARLGRFTSADGFVPAWASDLMIGTATASVRGVIQSIATTSDDRRAFWIEDVGLVVEADELVADGTLLAGRFSHATTDHKVMVGGKLRHEPLHGSAALDVVLDSVARIAVTTSTAAEATESSSTAAVVNRLYEWAEPIITLTRSDTDHTAGPQLIRWSLVSLPAPTAVEELILPVELKTYLSAGSDDQASAPVNTLQELSYFRTLRRANRVFPVLVGALPFVCRLDRLEVQPAQWNDDRSWFEGLVVLRLLTVEDL